MTRDRDATATRARILDAAEQLFAERGFDATPTAAIAKSASVPKGLLFYYFPAKADLLRALVHERLELGPIDTSAVVAPGDPARSLINLTGRLDELLRGSEVLRVILWREQHTHPDVTTNLDAHRSRLQQVVERVLTASIPAPIVPERVRAAAQAWVAIVGSRAASIDAAALRSMAQLICDGLAAQHPAAT
jgi:Transcriptional regulator